MVDGALICAIAKSYQVRSTLQLSQLFQLCLLLAMFALGPCIDLDTKHVCQDGSLSDISMCMRDNQPAVGVLQDVGPAEITTAIRRHIRMRSRLHPSPLHCVSLDVSFRKLGCDLLAKRIARPCTSGFLTRGRFASRCPTLHWENFRGRLPKHSASQQDLQTQ